MRSQKPRLRAVLRTWGIPSSKLTVGKMKSIEHEINVTTLPRDRLGVRMIGSARKATYTNPRDGTVQDVEVATLPVGPRGYFYWFWYNDKWAYKGKRTDFKIHEGTGIGVAVIMMTWLPVQRQSAVRLRRSRDRLC